MEYKTEFKFDLPFYKNTSFKKNGDEFSGTYVFDFTNNYGQFDILLLKIVPQKNFSDFNIVYNYIDKKPIEIKSQNNTLIYVLTPIGVLCFIGILATILRFCNKKKVNSNLIEGNIETSGTFLPQEEDKEQKQ